MFHACTAPPVEVVPPNSNPEAQHHMEVQAVSSASSDGSAACTVVMTAPCVFRLSSQVKEHNSFLAYVRAKYVLDFVLAVSDFRAATMPHVGLSASPLGHFL